MLHRKLSMRTVPLAVLLSAAHVGHASVCTPAFVAPPHPGNNLTLHNGVALQDVCFQGPGPFHVFVLGDWGGHGVPARPVDDKKRPWVDAVDGFAQQRVAAQMAKRAATSRPDYLLNVGDNFYWAGVETSCTHPEVWTSQWGTTFEGIYGGFGLDGKPWLGVLGNHDYGGFLFTNGWTQTIAYTWFPGGRWMTPAQYWAVKVSYPSFSVDYYFVDSNIFNAMDVNDNPDHNMCSLQHNPEGNCSEYGGPASVWECPGYFKALWHVQQHWLEQRLSNSRSDWQIVVTHFPPTWGQRLWVSLADKYGIDLIITGHVHYQRVVGPEDHDNFLAPSAWIVSGGGGGISSFTDVDAEGDDDSYGFVDLTLEKEEINITAISHGGQVRATKRLLPRSAAAATPTVGTRSAVNAGLASSDEATSNSSVGTRPAALPWFLDLNDARAPAASPARRSQQGIRSRGPEDVVSSVRRLARVSWSLAAGAGLAMALALVVAKWARSGVHLGGCQVRGLQDSGEAHGLVGELVPQ